MHLLNNYFTIKIIVLSRKKRTFIEDIFLLMKLNEGLDNYSVEGNKHGRILTKCQLIFGEEQD